MRGSSVLLGQSLDVIHHAEMHGAGHVTRPQIEIPARTDVEGIPARADQRRGAIVIILQNEPAAVERDVSVGFGIGRLLGDIEGEFLVRDELCDPLFYENAVAENALPIGADKISTVRGCRRIRKAKPENPVIGPVGNFRKGEDVRPDFRRRCVD